MAASEGSITTEVRDHILFMGLNRPEKYNGFTPTMSDQLVDAYTRLDEEDDLWVGVLFGHGDHFSAGLDLPKWTERMSGAGDQPNPNKGKVDPAGLGRWCRKPIVTALQGISFTLSIEYALGGDIVVADEDTRFSQLEPARGIHATGGATLRFVQRSGWGNAMYHLLTADEFTAEEAYRIGLIQEITPKGTSLARATELAEVIAGMAPLAVQATKASSRRYLDEGHAAAVAMLAPEQAKLMASADAAEGVQSFVERRAAKFTGR